MSNDTVVLAIFNSEATADVAADELRESGAAKGDAMAVLVLDDDGALKTDKMGSRSGGKGVGIGAIAALCTPVGLVAGLIGGGLLGSLHHKNLGLDKADKARLGSELQGGKAAVGVLVPRTEASFMADKLAAMGGMPETHQVSAAAVEEATKGAAEPA